MSKEYVIVTTVSHFRLRYAIPVDELRKENLEASDEEFDAIAWASDSVTMCEVEELSQAHVSEDIIDAIVVDEQKALELFDKDNDYLSSWAKQQKLNKLNKWKVNW